MRGEHEGRVGRQRRSCRASDADRTSGHRLSVPAEGRMAVRLRFRSPLLGLEALADKCECLADRDTPEVATTFGTRLPSSRCGHAGCRGETRKSKLVVVQHDAAALASQEGHLHISKPGTYAPGYPTAYRSCTAVQKGPYSARLRDGALVSAWQRSSASASPTTRQPSVATRHRPIRLSSSRSVLPGCARPVDARRSRAFVRTGMPVHTATRTGSTG